MKVSTLSEYEKKQVALDKYREYLEERIRNSVVGLDIEDLENMMDQLGIYNKYKESEYE